VNGEQAQWCAGEGRGEPAKDARLRAVNVYDVGAKAPHQSHDLEQAKGIVHRMDRSLDMAQGDEPRPSRLCGFAQRPGTMGAHDYIEVSGERGQ
jgi:hypothetical protein